jgi:hypothetical protein
MFKQFVLTLAAAGFAAGLAACASHFEVPEPTFAPPTNVPPIEPATITIPVSISMASLEARIDSVFPAADSLDTSKCSVLGGLVCHQYVYRRDTLDLKMINDRITLYTRLRFRARVGLPGGLGVASCGYEPETMRRADLRLATNLYWRNDWRLASRATVVAPNILDPCQVTMLRVDATPIVKRMIDAQSTRIRQQFDSIVPALADLRPAVDSLWRILQHPIALDSTNTIWFNMAPDGVSLAPLVGTGRAVTTALVVAAHPRIVVGSEPAAGAKPLPALTLAERSAAIHVPLEIELPFDDLSKRATAALAGEVAGQGITVRSINVWGAGDSAVVRVDLTGKISGAVFLLGRIGYDPASRSVLINDLNYTIASANKMTSIKAALGAIRIRHALEDATGHGKLAVGEQVDMLETELGIELNRELAPGVVMSGYVKNARVDRLYSKANAFVLRVVLDAEANVDVVK